MAIREVLSSFTFEQQRQMINLIGTDIGDAALLVTPSKVLSTSINQVVAGFVTLSGQTIQLEDGTSLLPSLSFDSQTNLGLYKQATDTLGISKNLFVGGNLTVDGDITFRAGNGVGGSISLGDLDTDNIVFNADVNSNFIPNINNTYDLGTASQQWKNIFIGTTAFINTLQVSNNATVTGTLQVTSGNVTTTSGTVNLFNNTAQTINAFGDASSVTLGSANSTLTTRSSTIVSTAVNLNVFHQNSTTINAFTSGQQITMGVTGSGVINTNLTIRSDDTVLQGKLTVSGAEILSGSNTFNILTNNSDVRIGSAGGTGSTRINNSLIVKGNTVDLTNQGVSITLKDNINPALSFKEGSNSYLDFQTTDGSEKIIVYKDASLIGSLSGSSASFTGNLTASGVTVNGNLIVNGTTTTINSTVLSIDDLNIVLADGLTTSATVDGAGITLGTTGISFSYSNTGTRWSSTENLTIASGKTYQIAGTTVLSATQVLGKGFTNAAGEIVLTDATQDLTNKKINGLTITSTTGTLTVASGKTLTANNSITFSGTDATVMTFPSATGTVVTADANQALSNKTLTLSAGSLTVAPILYTSGNLLTNSAAGAMEYDGALFYRTQSTADGRGVAFSPSVFNLIADGAANSAIVTGTNYFGANSNISLAASGIYEIEILMFYTATTANARNFSLIFNNAPTRYTVFYDMSPITGIVAPPGAAGSMLSGQATNQTGATYTVTTGSLSTGVDHYARFRLFVVNSATTTNMKINAWTSTSGSITPRAGSFWRCTRLPATNVGTYIA